MTTTVPQALAVIAGKGVYPRLLAESARKQGVPRIVVAAFRRETDPAIEKVADEVSWIYLGQFGRLLDTLRESGVRCAVMAGQITPTHLFRLRLDRPMLNLLKRLKARNAETIFGAVADELRAIGVDLLPASLFMEDHMPGPGQLASRPPTQEEQDDIGLGLRAAKTTSSLDIGQTVVVKQGTILAVEAFEGTDRTIRRAYRLGGPGMVIVKVAKPGHDMRFDIPVVGLTTMRLLKKVKAHVLAVEAGRAILLEQDKVIRKADAMGLALLAVETQDSINSPAPAPTATGPKHGAS